MNVPSDKLFHKERFAKAVAVIAAALLLLLTSLAGCRTDTHEGAHDHGSETSQPSQLWTCGMHRHVIRDKPGSCPICGMALEPIRHDGAPASNTAAASHAERQVRYWWDPMMNPPYISEKPGKSPMGMDLVPVYEDEVAGGTAIRIDPVVVQNMGVRTAPASRGAVERTVRAVGYITWAEPNIQDVNLRISGWVEKLYADTDGMHIEKGQRLFDLYSPDLQVAVEELIAARRLAGGKIGRDRGISETLYGTARRKLEQWGVDRAEIDRLSTLKSAPRSVTFSSPQSGDLTDKNLVEGAAVMAGQRALRIVDRSTVWLDTEVFPMDLPVIRVGLHAAATIEGAPEGDRTGSIIFIDPRVDPVTRTVKVRIALSNTDMSLRPGMFATVVIKAEVARDALLVPREAVIDTGARRIVFVAGDAGHFEPRTVKLGSSSDGGAVQVLAGLSPDDTVVVSGQFLLDAESRMQEAIQKHLREGLLLAQSVSQPEHGTHPETQNQELQAIAATPSVSGNAAPAWQTSVDNVVREYLKLAGYFGKVQEEADTAADLRPFAAAANSLISRAQGAEETQRAAAVLSAAQPLSHQLIDVQRQHFKGLSAAILELIQRWPPSGAAIGSDGRLYIMYCPMAEGTWLQDTREMANPYYATDMKLCAEIKGTVNTRMEH